MTNCKVCGEKTYNENTKVCMNPACSSRADRPMSSFGDFTHPPVRALNRHAWVAECAKIQPSGSGAQPPKVVAAAASTGAPKSFGTGAAAQPQRVAASPALTWRERAELKEKADAALKAQREAELNTMLEEILKQCTPPCAIAEGPDMFFRACGSPEEPRAILKCGFWARRPLNASDTRKMLASLYCWEKGIGEYMALYRGNANQNPCGAPFKSAGKKADDASGASNAWWQFAIQVKGLREVPVTPDLLGVQQEITKTGDVKLMMDADDIEKASQILLLHGPVPEATWLNHIPPGNVIAWIRLGGQEWQRMWRPLNENVLTTFYELTKNSTNYGIRIDQDPDKVFLPPRVS